MQKHIKLINRLWIILIILTLFSAYMAETATPGLTSITIMAVVLAMKGRIIVDYFMELKHAHVVVRTLMRMYFFVIPALIILVSLLPEYIANWTTL